MTQAPARHTTGPAAGLAHGGPRRLVGIARMAAASPQVRERAEGEYFALGSRTTLNRESSGRLPFAWTLNPYRGCGFGGKNSYPPSPPESLELWEGGGSQRKDFPQ